MTPTKAQLEILYRATTFRVETADDYIDIRIGQQHAKVDAVLSRLGAMEWAYVTAWNPGSRSMGADENALAQGELVRLIRDRRFEFYKGNGIPVENGWVPEQSIWIAGICRRDAGEVGRQFGQNAIVVGTLGGVAELVFCDV